MRIQMGLLTLSLIVVGSLTAPAQQRPANKARPALRPQKDACANAQTQSEMNQCAYAEYQRADAELNKVYGQTMAKLEMRHQAKLKLAQQAWLKFRDAHCECEAFLAEGGTMQPLLEYGCLATTTEARTRDLRALLKQVSR